MGTVTKPCWFRNRVFPSPLGEQLLPNCSRHTATGQHFVAEVRVLDFLVQAKPIGTGVAVRHRAVLYVYRFIEGPESLG